MAAASTVASLADRRPARPGRRGRDGRGVRHRHRAGAALPGRTGTRHRCRPGHLAGHGPGRSPARRAGRGRTRGGRRTVDPALVATAAAGGRSRRGPAAVAGARRPGGKRPRPGGQHIGRNRLRRTGPLAGRGAPCGHHHRGERRPGSRRPATAAAAQGRILGVAGGDGTVSPAAAVAVHGLPLLVIPAGTFNHFAADLGIWSVEDAVAALRAGRPPGGRRRSPDGGPSSTPRAPGSTSTWCMPASSSRG